MADSWRARPRLYQLALCMRLGVPIPELAVAGGVLCKGCGTLHDEWGRHPSCCAKGNRSYLWTDRHDGFQRAVQRAMWFARLTARAVGTKDYFGSANPPDKKLRADLVCMHYSGMGRHLFIDVAVTEPATETMTRGVRSAATVTGYAAERRAERKYAKYKEACLRVDSSFRDGVIERYGHCSDGLVGLVRLIAGAGKREPWEDDYSPTASSLVTHVAQCVVFGAVMADAAMLDAVLEMDVWGRERGADGRPHHGG